MLLLIINWISLCLYFWVRKKGKKKKKKKTIEMTLSTTTRRDCDSFSQRIEVRGEGIWITLSIPHYSSLCVLNRLLSYRFFFFFML